MGPGAASSAPVHSVCMESMATMPGGLPDSSVARMSSTLVAAPSASGAFCRSTRARRRHRLFAGDIDGVATALGVLAQRLKNERRLADAGVAADQQGRAGHQPAAGDAVELRNAGGPALRRGVFGLEVFQLEAAA